MAKRAVFKVSPQKKSLKMSCSAIPEPVLFTNVPQPAAPAAPWGRKRGNAADYGRTQRIRNALPDMAAEEGGPGSPRPSTKTRRSVRRRNAGLLARRPSQSVFAACARRHDPERAVFLEPRRAFVTQQVRRTFPEIVAQADADDLETLGMLVSAEAARRPIRQFTNRNCCKSRCAGRRSRGCCSGRR